jgi:hypothetical protein
MQCLTLKALLTPAPDPLVSGGLPRPQAGVSLIIVLVMLVIIGLT